MATRLYTTGIAAGISPSVAAGWEASGGLIRQAASVASADYAQILNATPTGTGVANDDYCHFQMVYGPIAAQTISGNVKGQFVAREVNDAADARAQIVIRVIASDASTVRGTLLNFDTAALSSEFVVSGVNTSVTNRKFPRGGSTALTSVAAQDGDYVVIEVGHRNHGTNAQGIRVISGGATGSGDLAEDETTTIDATGSAARGWIEFSQTITPLTQAPAGHASGTGTANNAGKTVKPSAEAASGTGTAYQPDISFLPPPRTITVNGTDRSDVIRLNSFSFTEAASRGEVGIGGFALDDATASLDVPALKAVLAEEPAASPKRMFTGYTQARSTRRGPNRVAGQREWDVEVVDINVLADDYVLSGAGANRAAETDYARVTWLLTTVFNTVGGVSAGVVPNSNTADMDAVDYRGRTPRDVLNECAEAAGKNWFIYRFSSGPLLYYDIATGTSLSSTARLSDVAADVDSSTTWAVIGPPVVSRNPDRIYSTVRLKYKRGTVTVSNATTLSTYRQREKSIIDLSVKSSTKATNKANKFLNGAANEIVEVSNVAVRLPRAYVNDIRAGQRIEIKLSRHGISAFTWYRIVRRVVTPLQGQGGVSDVEYLVQLWLASDVLPSVLGSGRGGDSIWEEKSNATDDGASVIVDSGGITITNGAITVTNAGSTVIIDGASNMFKIVATGTLATTSRSTAGTSSNTATVATGLTYDPINFIWAVNFTHDTLTPYYIWGTGSGLVTDSFSGGANNVLTDQTEIQVETSTADTVIAVTYRYYICKELAD